MFESYQNTHLWFTVKAGLAKWGPAGFCCGPNIFNSELAAGEEST